MGFVKGRRGQDVLLQHVQKLANDEAVPSVLQLPILRIRSLLDRVQAEKHHGIFEHQEQIRDQRAAEFARSHKCLSYRRDSRSRLIIPIVIQ